MRVNEVFFKYHIDDAVIDQFNNIGVINMCAIDESNKKVYYVVFENIERWCQEEKLEYFDSFNKKEDEV